MDPIWLGVIRIKLAEIGPTTPPPIGLNVYVVRGASPIPRGLKDASVRVMPALALDFLSLALPNLMY